MLPEMATKSFIQSMTMNMRNTFTKKLNNVDGSITPFFKKTPVILKGERSV